MPFKLVPIRPKKPVVSADGIGVRVGRELALFAADMVDTMADYPPQQSTRYRRTGSLGRHWIIARQTPDEVVVLNRVRSGGVGHYKRGPRKGRPRFARPYAVYVEGPKRGEGPGFRQARVMRRKGWQNITDESKRVWKRHLSAVRRAMRGM